MHDNPLILSLISMGNNLNKGKYLKAQTDLFNVESLDAEVAKRAAGALLTVMEKFNFTGFKPTSRQYYDALKKSALTIAHVESSPQSLAFDVTRTGLLTTFCSAGYLYLKGDLNKETGAAVVAVSGLAMLTSYFTHQNKQEDPIRATSILNHEEICKAITDFINNKVYDKADELIVKHKNDFTLKEFNEFKSLLQSFWSKGYHNETKAAYDTLYNRLDVLISARQAPDIEPLKGVSLGAPAV